MTSPLTSEEFQTPQGRKRAWRELMLGDHGVLRKTYDNSHEIAPGEMWRSFQPTPHDLEKWVKRGIKTIINLRGDKPSAFLFLEQDACDRLGLNLVTFRVFSREAPTKEILHGARKLFDEIAYPAMMHCKSGADRVGLMSVLFLFFQKGVPLNEALEQLSLRYGHFKQGKTGVIDDAFARYVKHASENNIPLSSVDSFFEWIDSDAYDPVAIKTEFRSKKWGDLLTEVILRRE